MNNAMGAAGFHHVALAARDFDTSLEFYQDGLGFPTAHAWGKPGDRAVMLDVGDGFLEIFERPGHPVADGPFIHLALRVPDCRAAHAAALEAGAVEKTAPKDVDIPSRPVYSVTISFVTGPDGEEIELFQER